MPAVSLEPILPLKRVLKVQKDYNDHYGIRTFPPDSPRTFPPKLIRR